MYQQDFFYEHTVIRQMPGSIRVIAIISIVLAVLNGLVGLATLVIGGVILLIPAILFGIISYFQFQNTNMSFDYAYTNGEIDIARVTGGRKRKLVLSIFEKDIVVIAPSRTDPVAPYIGKHMPVKDCSSHVPEEKYYVMICKDESSDHEVKVICQPGIEILAILNRMLPSKVYLSDEDKALAREMGL